MNQQKNICDICCRYDFETETWNTIAPSSTNKPKSRYGHSLTEFQVGLKELLSVLDWVTNA